MSDRRIIVANFELLPIRKRSLCLRCSPVLCHPFTFSHLALRIAARVRFVIYTVVIYT